MGKLKSEVVAGKGASNGSAKKLRGSKGDELRQNETKPDNQPKKSLRPIDPRFAAAHTDPRFERFPDRRRTVKIDPRFAGILDNPDFQTAARVDKRGRKVKSTKSRDDISKYYRLQREEGDLPAELDSRPKVVQGRQGKHKADAQVDTHNEGTGLPTDDAENDAARRWARLRGVGQSSESSSSSSDSEGDDGVGSDIDSSGSEVLRKAAEQWGVGALAANPAEHIPEGNEARRLAAMDLDWDHVRAVDIFAALRSFLPAGGSVQRVTVYPSDYGLQRMEEDARSGPQGIFKAASDADEQKALHQKKRLPSHAATVPESEADTDSSPEDDSEEDYKTADSGDGSHQSSSDEDTSSAEAEHQDEFDSEGDDSSRADEVDQTQLRMYERSKLRYYYAIIECDSSETAARIYAECDGLEFELSACKFDLRFVPDDQSFDGRKIRDSASELPEGYDAPAFQTQALQHSNVKSTWDADDKDRRRTLVAGKRATKDDIRDDDFKAYLASDTDDSEADDQEQQVRIRALLGGGQDDKDSRGGMRGWAAAAEEDVDGDEARRSDRNMEMQVSFGSGLDHVAKRTTTKKQEYDARKADTVWNQLEQRRRDKRAAAMAQGRKNADSDEDYISEPESPGGGVDDNGTGFFQSVDGSGFDDPFFQENGVEQKVGTHAQKTPKTKLDRAAAAAEKAAAKEAASEEARDRARLELLLMDEDEIRKAAPLPAEDSTAQPRPKVSKKERMRQKKAARVQERTGGSDDEDLGVTKDGFQANLSDPRFSALFNDDKYALDPTDPRFKSTQATTAIQTQRAAQRLKHRGTKEKQQAENSTISAAPPISKGHSAQPLQVMVAALKRKSQPPSQNSRPTERHDASSKQPRRKKQRAQEMQ